MGEPTEDEDDDVTYDEHEAQRRVGAKVIEAANMLGFTGPGAEASWNFEIDDVKFHIVVTRVAS